MGNITENAITHFYGARFFKRVTMSFEPTWMKLYMRIMVGQFLPLRAELNWKNDWFFESFGCGNWLEKSLGMRNFARVLFTCFFLWCLI